MSTEVKVKKDKKARSEKGEAAGDEQVVKKEKKDKKRKAREEEAEPEAVAEVESVVKVVEPAEESGETKEERRARKKAKKEVSLVLRRRECAMRIDNQGKSRCRSHCPFLRQHQPRTSRNRGKGRIERREKSTS
jgi:hypothetical protein